MFQTLLSTAEWIKQLPQTLLSSCPKQNDLSSAALLPCSPTTRCLGCMHRHDQRHVPGVARSRLLAAHDAGCVYAYTQEVADH